jgi:cysteine synthase
MKAYSIIDTIGNTPHLKINRLFGGTHEVWIKLERSNPGGSVKDRIAQAMVEDAESNGLINSETTIIEPTSGNTGIGLSMVAAVKGYRLILTMPESMSVERRHIMACYGAELVLTPKELGMKGAIDKAEQILEQTSHGWMPRQFENPANITVHREITAREILADFPEGFDYMITGVGTGGHISGCAQYLKPIFPHLEVFAVEPEKSAVISGGAPSPHRIQGVGAGFVPKNLDRTQLTGTISVSEEEAFEYSRRMALEEGVLVGISSGATLAAIAKKLAPLKNKVAVLGFCYDSGERYLSVNELWKE